ncbi:hypothetical protein Goklo_016982 [Gossypium klotzschianum]|uniref:Uncharacterized protein n=1 Tax=Gossypium klotzschianum TaxID=34286 RepID=A0A7J8UGM7_9ROSI|nr:hypothetical protein [Gossypium klotzschianum]
MLMVETVEWCLQKRPEHGVPRKEISPISRHLPRKELTWKKLSNA